MFTGIIEDLGTVALVERGPHLGVVDHAPRARDALQEQSGPRHGARR